MYPNPAKAKMTLRTHAFSSAAASVPGAGALRASTVGSPLLKAATFPVTTSDGSSARKTNGKITSSTAHGIRLNPVKIVVPIGRLWPVNCCTMFSLLPGDACARAMELEMPLAQIKNPLYAAATSQPKSMRKRLAMARASKPATTKPNPQFSQHAIAETTNVSDTAPFGVRGRAASHFQRARHRCAVRKCIAGDENENHLQREAEIARFEDALVPSREHIVQRVTRREREG